MTLQALLYRVYNISQSFVHKLHSKLMRFVDFLSGLSIVTFIVLPQQSNFVDEDRYTVNSRFKKDLDLQIHLHKAFFSVDQF